LLLINAKQYRAVRTRADLPKNLCTLPHTRLKRLMLICTFFKGTPQSLNRVMSDRWCSSMCEIRAWSVGKCMPILALDIVFMNQLGGRPR
jgi:hypothetical protein